MWERQYFRYGNDSLGDWGWHDCQSGLWQSFYLKKFKSHSSVAFYYALKTVQQLHYCGWLAIEWRVVQFWECNPEEVIIWDTYYFVKSAKDQLKLIKVNLNRGTRCIRIPVLAEERLNRWLTDLFWAVSIIECPSPSLKW